MLVEEYASFQKVVRECVQFTFLILLCPKNGLVQFLSHWWRNLPQFSRSVTAPRVLLRDICRPISAILGIYKAV